MKWAYWRTGTDNEEKSLWSQADKEIIDNRIREVAFDPKLWTNLVEK